MTLTKARPSLFTHVLDRLGSGVVGGTYNSTGMLPREQDLCIAMGASRTVVREAIRVLSQKGMLRAQQKVGVRILPPSSWNLMDIDVLDWIWRGGHYEPYVRDFLEFRLALEPVASYQAAMRASPEARQDILSRYKALLVVNEDIQSSGHRETAIETDIGFHTAIFIASGSHLSRYIGTLVTHMLRRQIFATTDAPGEFALGLELHGKVAEAIAAARPEDAFNYSHQLVQMPYQIYMRKVFAAEPRTFPVLEIPVPALESPSAILRAV